MHAQNRRQNGADGAKWRLRRAKALNRERDKAIAVTADAKIPMAELWILRAIIGDCSTMGEMLMRIENGVCINAGLVS